MNIGLIFLLYLVFIWACWSYHLLLSFINKSTSKFFF